MNASYLTRKGCAVAGADNTGYVDLTGLRPDTRYYYGVVFQEPLIDTSLRYEPGFPSFRTLPSAVDYRDPRYNPEARFSFGNRQLPGKDTI